MRNLFLLHPVDLKNITSVKGCPVCAIEKDIFMGSKRKRIHRKNKEFVGAEDWQQRQHCVSCSRGPG